MTAQMRLMSGNRRHIPVFPLLLLLVFLIGVLLIRQGQHECSVGKIAVKTIEKISNFIPEDFQSNLNERLGSDEETSQCKGP